MWAAALSCFSLSCPHTSPLIASATHHRHTSCLTHWSCCFAENALWTPNILLNDTWWMAHFTERLIRGWHASSNNTSWLAHFAERHFIDATHDQMPSLPLCKWEQRSTLKLVNVVLLVTECLPLFFLMKFSATRIGLSFALPKKQREPNLQKNCVVSVRLRDGDCGKL